MRWCGRMQEQATGQRTPVSWSFFLILLPLAIFLPLVTFGDRSSLFFEQFAMSRQIRHSMKSLANTSDSSAVDMDLLRAAAKDPVLIAIMPNRPNAPSGQGPFGGAFIAGTFGYDKPWHEKNCTWYGVPINCTYTLNETDRSRADALYIDLPGHNGRRHKRYHPRQVRFGTSFESAAYYSWQDDPNFMCQIDAEAGYRSCSQVHQTAFWEYHRNASTGENVLDSKILPYEEKQQAVAYLTSNCGAPSGRANIMSSWIELHAKGKAKVPVHSYGSCNHNMDMPEELRHIAWQAEAKLKLITKYRFCIAMENSIAYDYITEKIWDGLGTGCVPIYMGSPNVLQYVPDPQSVIIYGPGGNATTVEELDALVHRIGTDKALWERMVAWKNRPFTQLSPGYQHYRIKSNVSHECDMCRYIVKLRMNPQMPVHAVTCLWNETWMAEAGKQVASPNITC